MEQLASGLHGLPAELIQKIVPSKAPAGSISINIAALLQAHTADTDSNNEQQAQQQHDRHNPLQYQSGISGLSLTPLEATGVIELLFSQQLSANNLAAWVVQHQQKQRHSTSPGQQSTDATRHQDPESNAADSSASVAPPATAAQLGSEPQAVPAADGAVGGLPITCLDLSDQPVGLAGWQQLLKKLWRTNCVRKLVASNCNIEAAGAGDLLGVLFDVEYLSPTWPYQLLWLDLSYNRQLVLAGDDFELAHLLIAAEKLQGLCLQHTGMSGQQLLRLLGLLASIRDTPLDDDDSNNSNNGSSGGSNNGMCLQHLSCLKLGPLAECETASVPGGAEEQQSDVTSWPADVFNGLLQQLRSMALLLQQLKVLELYGLNQQQQQQVLEAIRLTVSSSGSVTAVHWSCSSSSCSPACCRLTQLPAGQLLPLEKPTAGFTYCLPPPKAAVPQAAAPAVAPAAAPAAGIPDVGFTTVPVVPSSAAGGNGGARPAARPAASRRAAAAVGQPRQQQQKQQQKRKVPSAAAAWDAWEHDDFQEQTPGVAAAAGGQPTALQGLRTAQPHVQQRQQQQQHATARQPVQARKQKRARDVLQQQQLLQSGIEDFFSDAADIGNGADARHGDGADEEFDLDATLDAALDKRLKQTAVARRQQGRKHKASSRKAAAAGWFDAMDCDHYGIELGSQDTADLSGSAEGELDSGNDEQQQQECGQSDADLREALGSQEYQDLQDILASRIRPVHRRQQQQQEDDWVQHPRQQRQQRQQREKRNFASIFGDGDMADVPDTLAAAGGEDCRIPVDWGMQGMEEQQQPDSDILDGQQQEQQELHLSDDELSNAPTAGGSRSGSSDDSSGGSDDDDGTDDSQEQLDDHFIANDYEDPRQGLLEAASRKPRLARKVAKLAQIDPEEQHKRNPFKPFYWDTDKHKGEYGSKGKKHFGAPDLGLKREDRRRPKANITDPVNKAIQQIQEQRQRVPQKPVQMTNGSVDDTGSSDPAERQGSLIAQHRQRQRAQPASPKNGQVGGRRGVHTVDDSSRQSKQAHVPLAPAAAATGITMTSEAAPSAAEAAPPVTDLAAAAAAAVAALPAETLEDQLNASDQVQIASQGAGAAQAALADDTAALTAVTAAINSTAPVDCAEPSDNVNLEDSEEDLEDGVNTNGAKPQRLYRRVIIADSEPQDSLELQLVTDIQQRQGDQQEGSSQQQQQLQGDQQEGSSQQQQQLQDENCAQQKGNQLRKQQRHRGQRRRRRQSAPSQPPTDDLAADEPAANARRNVRSRRRSATPAPQQHEQPGDAEAPKHFELLQQCDAAEVDLQHWKQEERRLQQLLQRLQQAEAEKATTSAAMAIAAGTVTTAVAEADATGLADALRMEGSNKAEPASQQQQTAVATAQAPVQAMATAAVEAMHDADNQAAPSAAAATVEGGGSGGGGDTSDDAAVDACRATAAAPLAAAAAAGNQSHIEEVQRQLKVAVANCKQATKNVKFLKDHIPFKWDKRGIEPDKRQAELQPVSSKRQRKAPMRLSPGRNAEQEKLWKQLQRQQQQQQLQDEQELFPVAMKDARGGGGDTSSRGAHRQRTAARGTTAAQKSKPSSSSTGSSSDESDSDESDSEDDLPLAAAFARKTSVPGGAAVAPNIAEAAEPKVAQPDSEMVPSQMVPSRTAAAQDCTASAVGDLSVTAPLSSTAAAAAPVAAGRASALQQVQGSEEAGIDAGTARPLSAAAAARLTSMATRTPAVAAAAAGRKTEIGKGTGGLTVGTSTKTIASVGMTNTASEPATEVAAASVSACAAAEAAMVQHFIDMHRPSCETHADFPQQQSGAAVVTDNTTERASVAEAAVAKGEGSIGSATAGAAAGAPLLAAQGPSSAGQPGSSAAAPAATAVVIPQQQGILGQPHALEAVLVEAGLAPETHAATKPEAEVVPAAAVTDVTAAEGVAAAVAEVAAGSNGEVAGWNAEAAEPHVAAPLAAIKSQQIPADQQQLHKLPILPQQQQQDASATSADEPCEPQKHSDAELQTAPAVNQAEAGELQQWQQGRPEVAQQLELGHSEEGVACGDCAFVTDTQLPSDIVIPESEEGEEW